MDAAELARLTGLAEGYRGHLGRWRRAVQLQDERIRAHPWQAGLLDRSVDTELFAVCLRNLLQACWACHGCFDQPNHTPFKDAIERFEATVPHVRVIRDRLQQFDRYGNDVNLDVFITSDEPDAWHVAPEGYSLHVNEVRLDLATAAREADRLAATALKTLDYVLYMLRITGHPPVWPEEQTSA